MILAVLNNKGGVGKTTTAVNLAAGLARRGQRTLLVDLDGQGSAALSLGIPRDHLDPGTAALLLEDAPLVAVTRPTAVPGLEVIAGSLSLADADMALADVEGREHRLRDALAGAGRGPDAYPHVILDCPPGLGIVTVNALVAADRFLVPVHLEYLALEGLVGLLQAVEQVEQGIGSPETPTAQLLGIVLTRVDYRAKAAQGIAELLREHYADQVFATEVKLNTRLAEAPGFGQTIYEYAPTSSGAVAYNQLTAEYLRRTGASGGSAK